MRIEVLVDLKTTLGESPVWDVEQQRLYWADSFDGRIFSCNEKGEKIQAWELGQKIGSFALRRSGKDAIVALANGLHLLNFETGNLDFIYDPEPEKTTNRLNDGKVDRQGRFVFGSMDTMEESANCGLYRLDHDLSVHQIDSNIIVSNGPCWSPDGSKFYFHDTWTGEIWVYDYNVGTGDVSNRRTFAKVDTSNGGAADGSTVDADGYLWNSLVYDGKLVRYSPDGKVDLIIDMPVKKVTSVMFGGKNLDILYVTSMAKPPLPRFPDDNQLRGSLFAIYDLGIKGVPEVRFGS